MSTAAAWADVRIVMRGPFRVLAVGRFFDSLGSGLTMSLLVVYLSQVRGIPVLTATLVLSWMAVIGLLATPAVGTLTDRFGPRHVILVAVVVEALGVGLTGFVTTSASAFAIASLVALGSAGIWGPMNTLTARLVEDEQRPTAFALGFMLLNLGLGLGGLIAASIVDISRPETFQVLYAVDACTYLALFVAVLALRGEGRMAAIEGVGDSGTGSWRLVLADRRLLGLIAVSLGLVTLGYASMDAGLSLYIVTVAGETPRLIGIVFLGNTLTIVLAQLFVLSAIRNRSRVRMMGVAAVLWGVAWLIIVPAPIAPRTIGGLLLVCFGVVFALGETVWSATVPALVNAIAPEHMRGRYNSAQTLTWSLGATIGPGLAGAMIGAGRGMTWAALVGVGCLSFALIAQALRRGLTPAQDGLTVP